MSGSVRLTLENPHHEICRALITELSAELGQLYGDDGSGAFKPDDVVGDRAGFVVAWIGDAAVGCGALRPMTDVTIAEVKRMYVRPAARGQGISRQILARLEALAREYRYERLWLETGTLQQAAVRLYETSGYTSIPCYSHHAHDPLSVCYEKRLLDKE
ncbi:MAG: GNAT family N-acetyltransferase [Anaerolineae bacterium]|nr:GNAT family N-acetyltransferase [Anaerolineae bacterium]